MKRTALRTSAIALGVAAALPATAQEWNLAWGGFMNQHVVFGSTDTKTTVNLNDLSHMLTSNRGTSNDTDDDLSFTIKFIEDSYDSQNSLTAGEGAGINHYTDGAALISALNEATKLEKVYVEAGALATLQTALNAAITLNAAQDVENLVVYVTAADDIQERVKEVNRSVDLDGSGQRRNTEVHFKPSITLENGITFAAQIEFEGDSAAGVDRSYMDIRSDSLGMIRIGSHPSMGYGMMVAAPSVGLGINSGAHPNFIPVSADGAAYSSTNEVGNNWEAMRISYMTPSLGGLTVGVSYAADGRGSGNSANHTGYLTKDKEKGNLSDILDIGLKFSQSLGEANVTLAARYGTGKQTLTGKTDKKPREAAVGAQVGFGAFTLGAAYADSQRYNKEGNDQSSSGWSLGASFKPNEAWTFGIETYQGEADNGDDHSVSKIAASRNLGPGVAWDIYAITAESTTTQGSLTVGARDPKPGDAGAAGTTLHSTGTTEGSGTIFGTAIKLSF